MQVYIEFSYKPDLSHNNLSDLSYAMGFHSLSMQILRKALGHFYKLSSHISLLPAVVEKKNSLASLIRFYIVLYILHFHASHPTQKNAWLGWRYSRFLLLV